MKKRFKRLLTAVWSCRHEFLWGVLQGVIGGFVGLLMAALYLRGR